MGFLYGALSKPRPLPCGELGNNNKMGGLGNAAQNEPW